MLRAGSSSGGASGTATYPGASAARLIIPFSSTATGLTTATNMPLALDFFTSTYQRVINKVDLTGFTQCRIYVFTSSVATVAGAKILAKYISAVSTTASDWLDLGTSEVSVTVGGLNTAYASSWIDIAMLAKGDVFLTVMSSGGDGVVDPTFGQVNIQVR